jgi:uncharacterized protein (TIGR03118 family)
MRSGLRALLRLPPRTLPTRTQRRVRPWLECLEDRLTPSADVMQANLMSEITQIENTLAAVERALSASANSLTSNLAQMANTAARAATLGGTVLQTNLVSDLTGVAAVTDPNLDNPWGIAESSTSPFWISENNAGLSTLYSVPGAHTTPVSIDPLVVSIPTPGNPLSSTGAPDGTVFNIDGGANGGFQVSGVDKNGNPITASADFLFATEDGTIVGWNPNVNPTGFAPANAGTYGIIAVDNSGNNFTNPNPAQQTGAVYKGLSIASSATPGTPIFASDANTTTVLYAANFRSGKIEVYDTNFNPVTLPAGAFTDPNLPAGYAPFNVQVLNDKVYVTYALQDADKHDDVAGPGHGFVDVFNLDGTPGLPGGNMRLISGGVLNSPWGLAIAPQGFAGLSAPNGDPVLLVGNFGNGFINAFDASTGQFLGNLKNPDGEPIQISGLWALKFGNGGSGGATNTLYFTAGLFGERYGLFGSLSTAAPGSPAGPAEAQMLQADVDVVQLDVQQLIKDISSGASQATIQQDIQTLNADFIQLLRAERAFAGDNFTDMNPTGQHGSGQGGQFGSLSTTSPGSSQGTTGLQTVQTDLAAFQAALQQLITDISSGASQATITQDNQTVNADFFQLLQAELTFVFDMNPTGQHGGSGTAQQEILDSLFADFGSHGRDQS